MPRARGEISWSAVHDAERYRQLSRKLREAGRGDLQRRLNREIRREGAGALQAVRRAWLGIDVTSSPSRGGGESSGLRSRTAAATRIQVLQSGIRVSVAGNRVDPRYGRSLTRGLNGMGRWRFPVWGNREAPWVQNFGEEVFYTTLRRYEPRWRRGVQRVMDDVARDLTS